MDSPKKVMERDGHFLKMFSIGTGICLGLVAIYLLVTLVGMLMSVS